MSIMLFVGGQQNVRANVLVLQMYLCLNFITRNKIEDDLFVSI